MKSPFLQNEDETVQQRRKSNEESSSPLHLNEREQTRCYCARYLLIAQNRVAEDVETEIPATFDPTQISIVKLGKKATHQIESNPGDCRT